MVAEPAGAEGLCAPHRQVSCFASRSHLAASSTRYNLLCRQSTASMGRAACGPRRMESHCVLFDDCCRGDRVSSVIVPLAMVAVGGGMVLRALHHLYTGTGALWHDFCGIMSRMRVLCHNAQSKLECVGGGMALRDPVVLLVYTY